MVNLLALVLARMVLSGLVLGKLLVVLVLFFLVTDISELQGKVRGLSYKDTLGTLLDFGQERAGTRRG